MNTIERLVEEYGLTEATAATLVDALENGLKEKLLSLVGSNIDPKKIVEICQDFFANDAAAIIERAMEQAE